MELFKATIVISLAIALAIAAPVQNFSSSGSWMYLDGPVGGPIRVNGQVIEIAPNEYPVVITTENGQVVKRSPTEADKARIQQAQEHAKQQMENAHKRMQQAQAHMQQAQEQMRKDMEKMQEDMRKQMEGMRQSMSSIFTPGFPFNNA